VISQVRERIEFRPVKAASWTFNKFEIAAAALALCAVLFTVLYYFFALGPEKERLRRVQEQFNGNQMLLLKEAEAVGKVEKAPVDVARQAKDTLEEFKTRWLKPQAQGRIAVINEINGLAKKNNVRLTSGIEMHLSKEEDATEKKSSKQKSAQAALEVYPKLHTQFTVFGQYANLRRFISELERSRQFLVIDSIQLSSVEETQRGGRAPQATGQAPGAGSGVSLSIGLSAYFQP
jgi:hypothetical protein